MARILYKRIRSSEEYKTERRKLINKGLNPSEATTNNFSKTGKGRSVYAVANKQNIKGYKVTRKKTSTIKY